MTRNSDDPLWFHLVLLRDSIFQDSKVILNVPRNPNEAHKELY